LYWIFGEKEKNLSTRAKEIFFIKTMNQKGVINIPIIVIIQHGKRAT